MKEKLLELNHLAPYLPYRLKIYVKEFNTEYITDSWGLKCQSDYLISCYEKGVRKGLMLNQVKPILRPLSDLFNLIDWDNNNDPYMIGYKYGVEKVKEDGVEFYANEYDADYASSPKCYIDITSFDWWLFENHFDVFGLIEKGLAININNL